MCLSKMSSKVHACSLMQLRVKALFSGQGLLIERLPDNSAAVSISLSYTMELFWGVCWKTSIGYKSGRWDKRIAKPDAGDVNCSEGMSRKQIDLWLMTWLYSRRN